MPEAALDVTFVVQWPMDVQKLLQHHHTDSGTQGEAISHRGYVKSAMDIVGPQHHILYGKTNELIAEPSCRNQLFSGVAVKEVLVFAVADLLVVCVIVLLYRVITVVKKMMIMWRRTSVTGAARILVKPSSSATTTAKSTVSSYSRCHRRYCGPTALFAMATVASIRPVATAMEASTSATSNAATTDRGEDNSNKQQCYSYGCPMLPQDVYYDEQVKTALAALRLYKREQVVDDDESLRDSTDDEDSSTTSSQDSAGTILSSSSELEALELSGNKYYGTLTLIGYKGGAIESQINQDRAFCVSPYILDDGEQDDSNNDDQNEYPRDRQLLGVFDGHANLGEKVSQYSVSQLPILLAGKLKKEISSTNSDKDDGTDNNIVQRALIETFIEIDKTAPAEISGGCTASVIYQDGNRVYVANAGDSQSFIAVYRANSQTVSVVYVSREDKPELPDERARVEQMGGKVYLPMRGTSRVLYTDPETGMQSGLAMSRSIGDWEAGKLGVIPDPIVDVIHIPELIQAQLAVDCVVSIDPDDGGSTINPECMSSSTSDHDDVYVFAVSATDGLMDFATPEVVSQTVASSLFQKDGPHLLTALEQLIYMSAQGWDQAKQGRYRDDIAIAVAQIRTPRNTTTEESSTASSS